MDEKILFNMEAFFLALADKTRLRLLNLMRENEVCVHFFVEALGESQPKISRHLACLRNAGIVTARRDGKRIHYAVSKSTNAFATRVLNDTLEWLASEEAMRDDCRKLAAVCGLPKSNVFAETHMNVQPKEEIEIFLL